jgi:hypothetical protein
VEVVRHGCVRGARRAAELEPSARPLTVGYPSPPEPEDEAIVLRDAVAGLGSGRAVLKVFRPGSSLRTTDPRLAGVCGTPDPDPDRVIPDVDVIVLPGPVRSSDAWLALNALASGVPVLVSDRAPLSEVLRDGPPDFRFRSGDLAHLREVLAASSTTRSRLRACASGSPSSACRPSSRRRVSMRPSITASAEGERQVRVDARRHQRCPGRPGTRPRRRRGGRRTRRRRSGYSASRWRSTTWPCAGSRTAWEGWSH